MQVLDPTLAAFVPEDRRRALLRGQELEPTQTGTALFADVSGFSALTTRLAESQGDDRGVGAMATHLADVFTVLVDACRAFGGTVVSFAGDAITCWFDGDDGRRAVTAASAMHDRLATVPQLTISTDDSTRVGLKVSAAHGTVTRAAIGDPDIQLIDVIAGEVVDRMSGGEKIAAPGETVVDQQIVANLGGDLRVATWRTSQAGRYAVVGSTVPAPPTPLDLEWPASHRPTGPNWLHPSVHEPLTHDPLAFTAQFRRVVVLFVGFDGPDLDADPRLVAELDRFVCDAQHCVDRYGGAVLGLSLGDKGSHLHATFGAMRRHEDDVTRALKAAEELVELAGGLISGVRIGLTSGPCYVGPFGAPDRQTYGVLGLEVNRAARLMAIAPPSTVVVPADLVALQPAFVFEPAGSAELKGFAEPVDICMLTGSVAARPVDGVGATDGVTRPTEQQELLSWLTDAQRGRSLLGVVSGPPGIGKSHLVAWLRRRAAEREVAVLVDGAESLGQMRPYQAVSHLTATALGIGDTADGTVEETCVAALSAIGRDGSAKIALLNDILGTDFTETAATEPLDGRARVDNTVELVSRLVHRWRADRPLVVLLEDAHSFDSPSWEVVHELVHLPRTLVVLTSRTPDPVPADTRPFDPTRVRRLELGPLGDADSRRLAAMCLGVTELPRTVAALVAERAEGNPLFVEELARSLRDRRQIEVVDGTCTVQADGLLLDAGAVPDTVEGVVLSRLDQLPPELRLVTRVASAIGRTFTSEVLAKVHPGGTPDGIDDQLGALVTLEVVERVPDALSGTYRFRHAITRDVAHESMTFTQRRSLHHTIGSFYEQANHGHHAAVAATLAYHWRHSDDRRRAVRYLNLAGQQALAANANREALDHLLAAERIARETEAGRWDVGPIDVPPIERARQGQAIGEAYYRLGNLAEASRRIVEAAAVIGRPIPTGTPGRVASIGAEIARQGAIRSLRAVADRTPASREPEVDRLAFHLHERMLEAAFLGNDMVGMALSTISSLNIAERLGPSPELADAYSKMCMAAGTAPLHRVARAYERLALDTLTAAGDAVARGNVLMTLALYRAGLGDHDRTADYLDEAIAIFRQLGMRERLRIGLELRRLTLLHIGRLADHRDCVDEMLESARHDGDDLYTSMGLTSQMTDALIRGCPEEVAALARATRSLESLTSGFESAKTGLYDVAAAHRLGRPEATPDRIVQAITAMTQLPPFSFGLLYPLSIAGELALDHLSTSGGSPGATAVTETALKGMARFARAFPIGEPRLDVLRGRRRSLERPGDERALAMIRSGRRRAEALRLPLEAAVAGLELGRATIDPRRRAEQLEQARDELVQLGAMGYVAVVDEALGS